MIEMESDSDETSLGSPSCLEILPPSHSAGRVSRKRQLPTYLRESIVTQPRRHFLDKVRVTCNQTGKAFFATLENLTNENGEELTASDIFDGNNVIYECSDGKSYDVTIREASVSKKSSIKEKKKRTKRTSSDVPEVSVIQDTQDIIHEATALLGEKETSSKGRFFIKECHVKEDQVADKSKQQSINSKTQRKHSASLAAKVSSYSGTFAHKGTTSSPKKLMDNPIHDLLIRIDKKLDNLENKVTKFHSQTLEGESETDSKTEKFIWNGINLLHIEAKDAYAYGRALLDALFQKSEQKQGIVFPTKKSKKFPLDQERVQLMFECIRLKYKDFKYSQMVNTLNQKCRDAKV